MLLEGGLGFGIFAVADVQAREVVQTDDHIGILILKMLPFDPWTISFLDKPRRPGRPHNLRHGQRRYPRIASELKHWRDYQRHDYLPGK